MPIYEFKCLTCGVVFDFMKFKSNDKVECPKCEEKDDKKLEKQISTGTGFQLKGRGWYKDGY